MDLRLSASERNLDFVEVAQALSVPIFAWRAVGEKLNSLVLVFANEQSEREWKTSFGPHIGKSPAELRSFFVEVSPGVSLEKRLAEIIAEGPRVT